ncbi:hypothetical protein ACOMHN_046540 [Nucella lapillus]
MDGEISGHLCPNYDPSKIPSHAENAKSAESVWTISKRNTCVIGRGRHKAPTERSATTKARGDPNKAGDKGQEDVVHCVWRKRAVPVVRVTETMQT